MRGRKGEYVKKYPYLCGRKRHNTCMVQEEVEAALLAPTAVNHQNFTFEYIGIKNNRHIVKASKGFSLIGYTKMDLGIAKLHFEIGAGKENFEWA